MESSTLIIQVSEVGLIEKRSYAKYFLGAYDYDLMLKCLKDIKEGRETQIPIYDNNTNARLAEPITIKPSEEDVVLVEGILLFYFDDVRKLFDMKLFVDLDPDLQEQLQEYVSLISSMYRSNPFHNLYVQRRRLADQDRHPVSFFLTLLLALMTESSANTHRMLR